MDSSDDEEYTYSDEDYDEVPSNYASARDLSFSSDCSVKDRGSESNSYRLQTGESIDRLDHSEFTCHASRVVSVVCQ